jgi:hypothetical protein
LIKIIEKYSDQDKNQLESIKVTTTDNKSERIFDNYPIVIMSKDIQHVEYETTKKQGRIIDKNEDNDKKEGLLDKAKEKALELKDSVVGHAKVEDGEEDKKEGLLDKAKEKALELKDSVAEDTKQISNDQNN